MSDELWNEEKWKLGLLQTLALDSMKAIPKEAENVMFWPLLDWKAEHGTGGPFVWGLWQEAGAWLVMEYYPHEDEWGCNTDVPTKEAGIDFIFSWMEDWAPNWYKLYKGS